MSTQRSPVQSPDLPESGCSKDDEDCLNDAIGEGLAESKRIFGGVGSAYDATKVFTGALDLLKLEYLLWNCSLEQMMVHKIKNVMKKSWADLIGLKKNCLIYKMLLVIYQVLLPNKIVSSSYSEVNI